MRKKKMEKFILHIMRQCEKGLRCGSLFISIYFSLLLFFYVSCNNVTFVINYEQVGAYY